jgi:thioester reductase-like protein
MRVLVTGASGHIGAELAGRLAAEGHAVIALTQSASQLVANDGKPLPTVAERADQVGPRRIASLRADVRHPQLGLAADVYERLATAVDLVVHCAALTEFGRPEAEYRAVNVRGTEAVLTLASTARPRPAPVVHVSTTYVCGDSHGRFGEDDFDRGQTFANAYEATKFEAERIVHRAIEAGVPATIVRVSIVVGASRTGRVRNFRHLYTLLRLFTDGRIRAIPARYGALVDLVPIDYVATALGRVALEVDAAIGRTFHIVGGRPLSIRDFSDVLAEYPAFDIPRVLPPELFSVETLSAEERRYHDLVLRMYAPYFLRSVVFSNDRFLATYGLTSPLAGKPLLRRILDYCATAGYLGRTRALPPLPIGGPSAR